MNILETIKAEREKLDTKVNAAIAERDAFIASIADVTGQPTRRHRSNRRVMSAAAKRKQSEAIKKRWAAAKRAGKNKL
ncbi:MAG: hypothetical protein LAP21_25315 [Acidobacteriia bacterium]|nr:hypothetical protein [Terriglobia bacterium]